MKILDKTAARKPMQYDRILFKGAASNPRVDKDNRVIRGYAVATHGEALGHGFWLDFPFLNSIVVAGNNAPNGVKSRFTHPSMSNDGLGKALGRAKNFRMEGDKVLADLHLLEAASNSPEGDLAEYIMELATEDPEMFGSSIVFERDITAEEDFHGGNMSDDGEFMSPDKDNKKNMPHVRMKRFRASDFVDSPAANPGGMFGEEYTDELLSWADNIVPYIFGLETSFNSGVIEYMGIHPERIRNYIEKFLITRNLCLAEIDKGGSMMSEETKEVKDEEATTPKEELTTPKETTVPEGGASPNILSEVLLFAAASGSSAKDVTDAVASFSNLGDAIEFLKKKKLESLRESSASIGANPAGKGSLGDWDSLSKAATELSAKKGISLRDAMIELGLQHSVKFKE